MIEKRLGDTLSAEEEFEKAKELDFYSLRTKKAYNNKISELASVSNLPLIDLDSLFLANNSEFLFIDHCHPTAEGHRLIAQALLERLERTGWLKD
jgi:phospholipase/lecithinase/hemolysin